MQLIKTIQIDNENYHFVWNKDDEIYHTFYLPSNRIMMEMDKAKDRIEDSLVRNILKEKTKQSLLDVWKGFIQADEVMELEYKGKQPL